MEISCKGRRAVVTAGGSGIGRVIAETLAENGAAVFTCDVQPGLVEDVRSRRIGAIEADVADPAQVDRLFEVAAEAMGGVDILVNNAGIAGPTAHVEAIEPADWDRTIAVNISGQFYCARRAVPLMRAAGRGAIVNISSTAGRKGFPLRLPYATSKFAITGLTKTLAIELGPANISVNAILPGYILNERGARVVRAKAEAGRAHGGGDAGDHPAQHRHAHRHHGAGDRRPRALPLLRLRPPHLGPAPRRRRHVRHLHGHG